MPLYRALLFCAVTPRPLPYDDDEGDEEAEVQHGNGGPNDRLQLLLHRQIHHHAVVVRLDLDRALRVERRSRRYGDYCRRGKAVENDDGVLALVAHSVHVREHGGDLVSLRSEETTEELRRPTVGCMCHPTPSRSRRTRRVSDSSHRS